MSVKEEIKKKTITKITPKTKKKIARQKFTVMRAQ
jgi:hypothetical protein